MSALSGTIVNTSTSLGIVLYNPATQNPVTINTGVYVTNDTTSYNGDAVFGASDAAWDLTNLGAIKATAAAAVGVELTAGGEVTNAASGLIEGPRVGIEINANPGTVVNYGTISGTGGGAAIYLSAGGSLANQSGGVIAAGADGVVIGGSPGSVGNLGTIDGGNLGVWLELGGSVANSGAIAATGANGDAVVFGNTAVGAGTLVNTGSITGSNIGVWLDGGGSVTNGPSGSISSRSDAVVVTGHAGSVVNFGTIASQAAFYRSGVYLAAGGAVVNGAPGASSALIEAGWIGVDLAGGGAIVNNGTVESLGAAAGTLGIIGLAAFLPNGGAVINDAGGLIEAAGFTALYAGGNRGIPNPGAAGTVVNLGTIVSAARSAIGLAEGGFVTNGASGAAGGLISGGRSGVALRGVAGSVANFGTIEGAHASGVYLAAGGAVSNEAGGAITGYSGGVLVAGAAGDVINSGAIAATGAGGVGIDLAAGGTIVDAGAVSGATAIVFGGGTDLLVVDPGAVLIGAVIGGGGTLELAAGPQTGTIAGLGTSFTNFTAVKVDVGALWRMSGTAAPALTNDGTILVSGGTLALGSVGADSGDSGLIDLAANGVALFDGAVAAGQQISFTDSTSQITLANVGGFAGAATGFQAGNTIDLSGIVANGYSYSGGILRLSDNGAQIAQLRLSTPTASPHFVLAADQHGGTAIALSTQNRHNIFSGVYLNGIILSDPATQSPPTITATAYVTNNSGTVAVLGAAGYLWTVTNFGRVADAAVGIELTAGGALANGAGGLVSGSLDGISILGGAGAVLNNGTLSATDDAGMAANFTAGGTLTNGRSGAAGGLITAGGNGVVFSGAPGNVVNFGAIKGVDIGIDLGAGGTVTNNGAIAGGANGILLDGALGAAISNNGLIDGAVGVTVSASDNAANTIVNSGTMIGAGGDAVYFAGGSDLLVVDPGAVFLGAVIGDGSGSTLDLAAGSGTGTLTGLGRNFIDFAAVEVDSGASWRLSGNAGQSSLANDGAITVSGDWMVFGAVAENAGAHGAINPIGGGVAEFNASVASGQELLFTDNTGSLILPDPSQFDAKIVGFAAGDTIDIIDQAANGFDFTEQFAQHKLTVSYYGATIAELRIAGNFQTSDFTLTADGHGGVYVTLGAPRPARLRHISRHLAHHRLAAGAGGNHQPFAASGGSLAAASDAASANPSALHIGNPPGF